MYKKPPKSDDCIIFEVVRHNKNGNLLALKYYHGFPFVFFDSVTLKGPELGQVKVFPTYEEALQERGFIVRNWLSNLALILRYTNLLLNFIEEVRRAKKHVNIDPDTSNIFREEKTII